MTLTFVILILKLRVNLFIIDTLSNYYNVQTFRA